MNMNELKGREAMRMNTWILFTISLVIAFVFMTACGKKDLEKKAKSENTQKSTSGTQMPTPAPPKDDLGQEIRKTQQPSLSTTEQESITPPTQQALQYDLGNIRSFKRTSDMYGRSMKETYSLPDRKEMSITYSWEGGTNRCKSAEATINGHLLAKAVVLGIEGNEREGYYQEVDETHYATGTSGKVVYRARSKFAISSSSEKLEEKLIEGTKAYELFTHWGTVELTGY